MKNFIKYLMLCNTLILYCCLKDNHQAVKEETNERIQEKSITLTNHEQQKFDSLIHSFTKILNKVDQLVECKNRQVKCKMDFLSFSAWISKNPKKQKELVNAFTTIYDFLEIKRKKHASNKKFNQYISDAIDNVNSKYDNHIYSFFKGSLNNILRENNEKTLIYKILDDIFRQSTNDKIFERMKEELSENDSSNLKTLLKWQD